MTRAEFFKRTDECKAYIGVHPEATQKELIKMWGLSIWENANWELAEPMAPNCHEMTETEMGERDVRRLKFLSLSLKFDHRTPQENRLSLSYLFGQE